MPQPKAGTLTEKQKRFCDEYIANGYNTIEAYNKIYGKKESKPSYPYTLLSYPQVKEYIQQRRTEIYEALNIDAMRIIQELADMAFADKDDQVYVPTVKLRALEQLSKNLGLQTQKVENSGVIEITLEEENPNDAEEGN